MSAGSGPQTNPNLIEETRKQINRLIEEISQLSEKDMLPSDYYAEFLKRVLAALTAPAAAVWGRTAQGNLQLQYQINMRQVGLDQSEEARGAHDELLRQAVTQPQPMHLPPHSSGAPAEDGAPAPGNPTDFTILIVPIQVDNQVAGLLEVWQSPDRHPNAVKGFLQFLVHMSELASRYQRNHMLRQMVGQQQVWTQMEAFTRQIHSSLNPVEVGYLIANEARRLVNCDRVSVAVRYGKRTSIDAVSGADVVEKRSNLIVLMRKLAEAVMTWGEKLIFSGEKDDSLPPDVLHALDLYLAESNSKLLVILPLRDEREIESESKNPPRSALIMESFEPPVATEQMIARLEVVGRHGASALYNAVEHRRIPMRFVWMPLAMLQEGLGGTVRAIIFGVAAGLVALIVAMCLVPYPLKMEANGKLLPMTRPWVYSTREGKIVKIDVKPRDVVGENQSLIYMFDLELRHQLEQIDKEIERADSQIKNLSMQLKTAPIADRTRIDGDREGQKVLRAAKAKERETLVTLNNADRDNRGYFWLKSPRIPYVEEPQRSGMNWTVLSEDFQELTNRTVRPSDPLLRLGDLDGSWEVELKIPQKHIGQVLGAFERYKDREELDVDLLVTSTPTRSYLGKLRRDKIGGQANPDKNEAAESEPVVLAYVRIEGPGIPVHKDLAANKALLVTGTEVHANIRCGNRPMGYSLFYGVWEFIYEKVWFRI